MATSGYIGIDGVARKIKAIYVGVNGVARKVKAAYVGVANIARKWFAGLPDGTLHYVSTLDSLGEAKFGGAAAIARSSSSNSQAIFFGGSRKGTFGTTVLSYDLTAYNQSYIKTVVALGVNYSMSAPVGVTMGAEAYFTSSGGAGGFVWLQKYTSSLSKTGSDGSLNMFARDQAISQRNTRVVISGGRDSTSSPCQKKATSFTSALVETVLSDLSAAKGGHGGAQTTSYIIFAGGDGSNTVDSYNASFVRSTLASLPKSGPLRGTVLGVYPQGALFAGQNIIVHYTDSLVRTVVGDDGLGELVFGAVESYASPGYRAAIFSGETSLHEIGSNLVRYAPIKIQDGLSQSGRMICAQYNAGNDYHPNVIIAGGNYPSSQAFRYTTQN